MDDDDEDDDDDNNDDGENSAGGADPETSQAGPSTSPTKGKGAATPSREATPAPKKEKAKVSISYDKYMSMMQLVVYHLAEVERSTGAGMRRNDLIMWYLESVEKDLANEEELDMESTLIEKVLKKLIKVRFLQLVGLSLLGADNCFVLQEKYLLELRGEGLQSQGDEETQDADVDMDDVILSVHPECDIGTD